MNETADIVVIGAGAAGAAFAWAMAGSGLSVVCLEMGDWMDYPQSPLLAADWELAAQGPRHSNPNVRKDAADYPVDESATPIRPAIYNGVGGSTLLWGAHFPRFRPSDFRTWSLDGVGADWPIRYADLAPWYDHVERHAGISGSTEGLAQLPDGQFQPAMPLNCGEELVAGRLRGRFDGRRRIIPGRVANLTRPLPGRVQC